MIKILARNNFTVRDNALKALICRHRDGSNCTRSQSCPSCHQQRSGRQYNSSRAPNPRLGDIFTSPTNILLIYPCQFARGKPRNVTRPECLSFPGRRTARINAPDSTQSCTLPVCRSRRHQVEITTFRHSQVPSGKCLDGLQQRHIQIRGHGELRNICRPRSGRRFQKLDGRQRYEIRDW